MGIMGCQALGIMDFIIQTNICASSVEYLSQIEKCPYMLLGKEAFKYHLNKLDWLS